MIPLIFFSIFTGVALIEEVFWSIRSAYNEPFNAFAKSSGILIGTVVFWSALVQTQTIIGGSEFEIILSGGIAIGAMLLGVYLRIRISE